MEFINGMLYNQTFWIHIAPLWGLLLNLSLTKEQSTGVFIMDIKCQKPDLTANP